MAQNREFSQPGEAIKTPELSNSSKDLKEIFQSESRPSEIFDVPAPIGKEISECTLEEIKQPIRYAIAQVGLRPQNFPSETEKLLLINFIRRQYPSYTPAEIAFAFDQAMARRLPVENVCCYENFSCEYIGRILSAYEKWDSSPVTGHSMAIYGMLSDQQKGQYRGEAQAWYERYLSGAHIDFIPANIYRILVQDRLLVPIANPAERREYVKFLRVMECFEQFNKAGQPWIYIRDNANDF